MTHASFLAWFCFGTFGVAACGGGDGASGGSAGKGGAPATAGSAGKGGSAAGGSTGSSGRGGSSGNRSGGSSARDGGAGSGDGGSNDQAGAYGGGADNAGAENGGAGSGASDGYGGRDGAAGAAESGGSGGADNEAGHGGSTEGGAAGQAGGRGGAGEPPLLEHLGGGTAERLPHGHPCRPGLAAAPDGTLFMAHQAASGTDTRVARLRGDAWEPVGASVQDAESTSLGFVCRDLVVDSDSVPYVAFLQSSASGTALKVRSFTGSSWQDVGDPFTGAVAGSGRYALAVDGADRLIIASTLNESDAENHPIRVRRFEDGAWQPLGATFENSVIGGVRLALRPDGTPVVAFQKHLGSGSTGIFLAEFDGQTFSSKGLVTSVPDSFQTLTLMELDVDATRTIVTYSRAVQGGVNEMFTRSLENEAWVLVGDAGDQPADVQAEGSSVLLGGELLQIFHPLTAGAVLRLRRFTDGAWTVPQDLPIQAINGNLLAHDGVVFLGYVFPNPDGAVLARLNLP